MIAAFLFVLAAGSLPAQAGEEERLPRSLQEDEPAPRASTAPPKKQEQPEKKSDEAAPKAPESGDGGVLDFGKTALEAHIGYITFSSDFQAGMKFSGGVGVRVPSPLLSGVISSDPERIALFLDLTFSGVDRDIPTSDTSGMTTFVTLGADAAFVRRDGIDARIQVGAQYGSFGGVEGLDNGIAFLIGLRTAVDCGGGIWVVLDPQVTFGKSDAHLFFLNLGVDLQF